MTLSGMRVLVPVEHTPYPETLAQIPEGQALEYIVKALSENERHGSPNTTLRPPTLRDAAHYLPLASSLNLRLFRSSSPETQPPPSTSLNRRLHKGTTALPYFTYEIWAGIRGNEASEAFDAFVSQRSVREKATACDVEVYFDSWREGHQRVSQELALGAGKIDFRRVDGYMGWSNGFDFLPLGAAPYFRVSDHFLMPSTTPKSFNQFVLQLLQEFKDSTPRLASQVYVFASLISSAEAVDASLPHADVSDQLSTDGWEQYLISFVSRAGDGS